MNDKLSAIWDLVIVIVFACVRGVALCYGFVGMIANRTDFMASGILLYLVSNTWEKIMDEKTKSRGSEDKEKLSWLGKNCKDCGNEKCKKLGTLPKGYDCALWQSKVENYSIKTVTNAKDAENYPTSEDISKAFEEFSKTMSIQRRAESEDEE